MGRVRFLYFPLFQPCFLLVAGILAVQVLINLFPGWGGKGLVARQESLQCPGRACESSKPGREHASLFLD